MLDDSLSLEAPPQRTSRCEIAGRPDSFEGLALQIGQPQVPRVSKKWREIDLVQVPEAGLPGGDGVERIADTGDSARSRHHSPDCPESEQEFAGVLDREHEIG